MNDGWIKMYRKFLDWKWYDDINTKCLFLHLLLRATYEELEWHNMTLKVGQYVTTISRLAEEVGLTPKKIRLSLSKLESTGEIVTQTANKFSIITICNFESYQEERTDKGQTKGKQRANKRQTKGKQRANKRQTKGKQRATEEEIKNIKNNNNSLRSLLGEDENSVATNVATNLKKRESSFYESLIPFVEIYGKDMIRAFFNYWSEPNKSQTKMRYELEKTWDVKRRLTTWSNRQKENNNGAYSHNQQKTLERSERQQQVSDLIARLRAQDQSGQE